MSDTTIASHEQEVERNREQLADTVDALQAKLDVKSQARARLARARDRSTTDAGTPRPEVLAAVGLVVVAVVALVWWRRR